MSSARVSTVEPEQVIGELWYGSGTVSGQFWDSSGTVSRLFWAFSLWEGTQEWPFWSEAIDCGEL